MIWQVVILAGKCLCRTAILSSAFVYKTAIFFLNGLHARRLLALVLEYGVVHLPNCVTFKYPNLYNMFNNLDFVDKKKLSN